MGQALVRTQHGGIEAAALHLLQLVYQHVAGGTQLAFETESTTQQVGLAVGCLLYTSRCV